MAAEPQAEPPMQLLTTSQIPRTGLPAAAIAVVDVEQTATVVLQAANAAVALEVGVDRADIAVDAEVDGITRQVLGLRRAANGAVVALVAAGRVDRDRAVVRGDLINDGLQRAIEAARRGNPADAAARQALLGLRFRVVAVAERRNLDALVTSSLPARSLPHSRRASSTACWRSSSSWPACLPTAFDLDFLLE